MHDRRLARIVARCQDLPGHELFQYVDDDGERQPIDSQDVNDYLREITRPGDHGERLPHLERHRARRRGVARGAASRGRAAAPSAWSRAASSRVAQRLGNTKAVCRKCYVHPAVIDAYMDGSLEGALGRGDDLEGAVLKWLRTLY